MTQSCVKNLSLSTSEVKKKNPLITTAFLRELKRSFYVALTGNNSEELDEPKAESGFSVGKFNATFFSFL